MTIRECYTVLELEPNASLADVKQSWKLLAAVWHPDRFQNNANLRQQAEQKLKRINAAYDLLRDHLSRGGPPPGADGRQTAESDHDRSVWRGGCFYRGGDPRLRQVSLPERWRRATVVQVSIEGILLVTFDENEPDEGVAYPKDAIIELQVGHEHWGKPSLRINDPLNYEAPRLASNRAILVAKDPNGIVARVRPELEFRDAYSARIFRNQVRELCCPVDLVAKARVERTEVEMWQAEARAQREAERKRERIQEAEQNQREAEEKQREAEVQAHRAAEHQRREAEERTSLEAECIGREEEENPRHDADQRKPEAELHAEVPEPALQRQGEAPGGRGEWAALLGALSAFVFVPFLIIWLAGAFQRSSRDPNQHVQADSSAGAPESGNQEPEGPTPQIVQNVSHRTGQRSFEHRPSGTKQPDRTRQPPAERYTVQRPPTSDVGQIINSAWQALKVSDYRTVLRLTSELDRERPATANLYRGWVFLEQRRDAEAYKALSLSANELNTMAWVSLAALAAARETEGLPPLGPSAAEFVAQSLRSDRSDAAARYMRYRVTTSLPSNPFAEPTTSNSFRPSLPNVSEAQWTELDRTPYRKVWRFFEVLGWRQP